MKGTNAIRKQELHDRGELQVHHVFPTLQGEGPLAGTRAVFVRLTGCMLQCFWCDTEWNDEKDHYYAPAILESMILKSAGSFGGDRPWVVVLTGGEPLRQNILPLLRLLVQMKLHVQIETAGVYWLDGLESLLVYPNAGLAGVSLVCSPKAGGVHDKIALHCRHWKYIVRQPELDEADGLPFASTQVPGVVTRIYRPFTQQGRNHIYVQPCDEGDETKNRANLSACINSAMSFGYQLCIQQHKIVGLP